MAKPRRTLKNSSFLARPHRCCAHFPELHHGGIVLKADIMADLVTADSAVGVGSNVLHGALLLFQEHMR